MRQRIWIGSLSLFVALLMGCAGSVNSTTGLGSGNPPTEPSYASLAGSWQFTAASTAQPGYDTLLEVNLQQSGANLSANGSNQIFIVAENPSGQNVIGGNCPGNGNDSVTGTTTGTSVSFTFNEGGNLFTITGTVGSNGTTMTGTYQSSGGGCADSGTFSGTLIPSVNGTYSGQLNFPDGTTDGVTAILTESSNDSLTVNATVSGMDTGTTVLTGTVIGGGFSASGTFQGQPIAYYSYYDASLFALLVFEASSGEYVGSLYAAGHAPTENGAAFVQSANFTSQSTASSFSATFNNKVNTGDLIAIAFWWNNQQENCTVPISDSAGNIYNQVLKTSSIDSNDWVACVYIAQNVNGASNLTVTVNPGSPISYQFSLVALEYSGVANVDATSTTGGTSGMTVTSGPATTHYPNEVLLGIAVADVDVQAGSGFNSRFTSPYFCVEDELLTSTGAYQATFSTASTIPYEGWDAGMVTIH
jgi:hypothetical protein